MPMYEFMCAECESEFETLVPSADAVSSVECPKCSSGKVHKKLSLFGVAAGKASSPGSSYTEASPVGEVVAGECAPVTRRYISRLPAQLENLSARSPPSNYL